MESQDNRHGIGRSLSSQLISEWGISILLIFMAFLWLGLMTATWAFSAEPESSKEDEYSFNWLDPDKKIYVLQNRKYLKAGHPTVSLLAGTGFSNPYRNAYNLDPRLAYYLTEAWGIEVFYTITNNSANTTQQALELSAPNTLPSIREIRSQYGGMLHYVPWYAKINVFNSILYFDWYFGAGMGIVQTFLDTRTTTANPSSFVQKDQTGLFLSTGHHYHLSQNLTVRIDLTGAFYQSPIRGTTGETAWYSNFNFGFGLGWRI